MANPSSSTRERERERGERSSSHRHSRTISSTTLLLVLSLVLAVLAVMLSLPAARHATQPAPPPVTVAPVASMPAPPPPPVPEPVVDPEGKGVWSYLTPSRSKELLSREQQVAQREYEVARREAELLGGSPGGIVLPTCSACPPAPTVTAMTYETVYPPPPPVQTTTVIQEVYREYETSLPAPGDRRSEDLSAREYRVSDREKDVGRREEVIGRRELDIARRESWIMEQLINIGEPHVEEEFVYDEPPVKRKLKELPRELPREVPRETIREPPRVQYFTETETELETHIHTETVTSISVSTAISISTTVQPTRITVFMPEPAGTKVAARPAPQVVSRVTTAPSPGRTTVKEVVTEEEIAPGRIEIVEDEVERESVPPGPPVNVPIPPIPPVGMGGQGGIPGSRVKPKAKIVEVYEDDDDDEEYEEEPVRTVTVKRDRASRPTPPARGEAREPRGEARPPPRPSPNKRWFGGF